MKGIIFNYLEEFIIINYSEEEWDLMFKQCPVKTQELYIGPATYPDSHLVTILQVVSRQLNESKETILRKFGEFLFKRLSEDYSNFVKPFVHPKPFLLSIDNVIHIEVMKMMEKAFPPKFTYEDPEPNRLIITYNSKRKLCYLMEGILDGVSKHFNTPLKYTQQRCLLKGDTDCCFDITFLQGKISK